MLLVLVVSRRYESVVFDYCTSHTHMHSLQRIGSLQLKTS